MPTLRIDADSENLAAIRGFVRAEAAAVGAPDDAVADLVQAVDEAATNVIVHGYRDGAPGTIEVHLVDRDGEVAVTIVDDAPAFDPTVVPEPDLSAPLARRPLGGMGVHLIRGLCDDVRYRRSADGRNELTMTKRTSTGTSTSTKAEEDSWISR